MDTPPDQTRTLQLPTALSSPTDVRRLLREVEAADDFMMQAAIRAPGQSMKMPKTSRLLDEMATGNNLNMLRQEDRAQLRAFLVSVKDNAPVLHISFGVDPSPLFMQKLVDYLRHEIHPFVTVSTGLQPAIGAGCVVRSTNKYFDFSLRQRFSNRRNLLMEKLVKTGVPVQQIASQEPAK